MDSGPRLPVPTWFVGCGNMGGAIVAGWRAAGVDLSNLVVIRPSGTPIEGVRVVRTFAEAGAPPKMVVLAFKPQKLDEIAPELRRWITSKCTVVSILAGVETESLRERFYPVFQFVLWGGKSPGEAISAALIDTHGEA